MSGRPLVGPDACDEAAGLGRSAARSVGRWQFRRFSGSVADLHGIDPTQWSPEEQRRPALWLCDPTHSAIVLGSTQTHDLVDVEVAARRGLDIVVRRSGGGAVLVVPGDVVWVDIWVPREDALWHDDVGVATHWLGEVWATVAGRLEVEAQAHVGAMRVDALGRLVCFVGVGPGEVLVDGAKLVGISQRRVRAGARFQCQWVRRWAPDALLEGLGIVDPDDRRRVTGAGVGVDVDVERLMAALVEVLAER